MQPLNLGSGCHVHNPLYKLTSGRQPILLNILNWLRANLTNCRSRLDPVGDQRYLC
jgi:hypothetical protein